MARFNRLKFHWANSLAGRILGRAFDMTSLQVVRGVEVKWVRHLLNGEISREGHLVRLHTLRRIHRAATVKGTLTILTVANT